MTLREELHMAEYWIEDKGLEEALTPGYLPLLSADTDIANALSARRNTERAILKRIDELREEVGYDD